MLKFGRKKKPIKNKIPALVKERDLSLLQLQQLIEQNGDYISYPALLRTAGNKAEAEFSDQDRMGKLRKIAAALGVSVSDLID